MPFIDRLIVWGWVLGLYAWAVATDATIASSAEIPGQEATQAAAIDWSLPASW